MTDALTDNILVLVRHGESEWNRLNLFTGWRNPDLTEKGLIEARVAGRMIRDDGVKFDIAFTSVLKRAQHTLDIILSELNQPDVPIIRDPGAERTRLRRTVRPQQGRGAQEVGRRSGADLAPLLRYRAARRRKPQGHAGAREALLRSSTIWPQITQGKNVIVAAHGNSLRALVMILENLSGDEILQA